MKKKLALLGFLMLVSVGMVYVTNALGALQFLQVWKKGGQVWITAEEDEWTIYKLIDKLSEEQRAKATEIAMGDPRVQEILKEADDYQISVYDFLYLQEIEDEEKGKGFAIARREGFALVVIRIFKKYDQELGLNEYEVIVDLSEEKVTEIREHPEVRKPKPTFNPQNATGDTGYIDLTQAKTRVNHIFLLYFYC